MEGKVAGTTHLARDRGGAVGAIAALRDDDYSPATYRGTATRSRAECRSKRAFASSWAGPPAAAAASAARCIHRGRPGLLGAFAIVGAGLPSRRGRLTRRGLQGRDSVALTFMGDGATNIGTFTSR